MRLWIFILTFFLSFHLFATNKFVVCDNCGIAANKNTRFINTVEANQMASGLSTSVDKEDNFSSFQQVLPHLLTAKSIQHIVGILIFSDAYFVYDFMRDAKVRGTAFSLFYRFSLNMDIAGYLNYFNTCFKISRLNLQNYALRLLTESDK